MTVSVLSGLRGRIEACWAAEFNDEADYAWLGSR